MIDLNDIDLKVLLELLVVEAELLARIAGLGISLRGDQPRLVWYVTEASQALQEKIDHFVTRRRKKLLKDLSVLFADVDHQQQVQVGMVQPVALGSPVSVVTLGARVALDNDPTDGTLGAILTDGGGNRYLLSCRHVLNGAPGDRVVLRNAIGDDQCVARLTAISNWQLGAAALGNLTDFALAKILDSVVSDSQTPIGTPPLKSLPASGTPVTLSPLQNLGRSFTITDHSFSMVVDFPYGEIRLSNMWLVETQDSGPLANFGDSGSLFVTPDRCGGLAAAALAVAMSGEYSPFIVETGRVKKGDPRLLLCPMQAIFSELAGGGITNLKIG